MTTTARTLATLACAALLGAAAPAHAAGAGAGAGTQVTLTGKLACAMCILKQPGVKSCANVLVVQEEAKDVVYALADNDVTRPLVMAACEKTLPVKVTGTVVDAAGKKTITASKVERT